MLIIMKKMYKRNSKYNGVKVTKKQGPWYNLQYKMKYQIFMTKIKRENNKSIFAIWLLSYLQLLIETNC